MNNNQTVEKLKSMRLSAMSELHLQHVKNNQFNDITPDDMPIRALGAGWVGLDSMILVGGDANGFVVAGEGVVLYCPVIARIVFGHGIDQLFDMF